PRSGDHHLYSLPPKGRGPVKLQPKALGLSVVSFLLPALAAKAARAVSGKGLERGSKTHPQHPAHPNAPLKDAVRWTLITGAVGALARLGVQRWMAQHPRLNEKS
ncbi:MAG: DUF4235 domain-containing protein, partial [Verrucomicrobiales bacterium]